MQDQYIRLNWQKSSSQPHTAYVVNPLISAPLDLTRNSLMLQNWLMQNCLSSNAEKKRFSTDSKSVHSFSSNRKKTMPGTAARCWYHTSGFRFTDPSYYLESFFFLEGLMSSCRSRRESHNCSELSYRILKWSASDVQKTPTKQSDTMKMKLSLSL